MHHHITLRLREPRALCPDDHSASYLARLVSAVGARHGLIAWRARGDDVQLLLRADAASAGQAARRIAIGAQQVLGRGARFRPSSVVPVPQEAGPQRLRDELLFADTHDPTGAASSLPDALGLRALAPYVRGSLPGCGHAQLRPPGADLPLGEVADWGLLARSAAAVWGHADLSRRYAWRASALSAAAALAFPELGPTRLARLLGVSRSTMHRALDRRPVRGVVAMTEAQLRWRSAREGRAARSPGSV